MTVDSTGQIYVDGASGTSVSETLVYAANGSTPSRTISFTPEGYAICVDSSGSLYVATASGQIWVYAPGANGLSLPTRMIDISPAPPSPGFAYGITVDAAGSIYVAMPNSTGTAGSVMVFSSTANGNAAPTRTIPLSQLPLGVAVDAAGDVFVSQNNIANTSAATIEEFPAGSTTASKTITLTGTTPSGIGGLSVDSAGNVYAIMGTGVSLLGTTVSGSISLVGLSPSVTGNTAPTTQMSYSLLTHPGIEIAIK